VRPGVRGKLFLVYGGVIVGAIAASGAYLEAELRARDEARLEAELHAHAWAARELVALVGADTIAAADDVADRLGAATSARVTVIGPDGAVLGDSDVAAADIPAVENHRERPEVRDALAHQRGVSQRHSATIDADMLYVAIPCPVGGGTGVVRVALPLAAVDAAVHRLRLMLLVAGLVGVAIAFATSALASHLLSRTLRDLVDGARAMARTAGGSRVPVSSADELGGLAGSLNKMADELERTVATLALERRRFEAVLDGMSEAVLALDADQRIEVVNPAAVALLQLPALPVGHRLLEAIRVPELQEVALGARSGERASVEFNLRGSSRRVLATATPQQGGAGSVIVLHDMTEVRRLETVRRDFVANVSHELRTPVSVVRANAETLLAGGIDDAGAARPLLEALVRQSERLSRIIADLLDLSRLDAGQYELAAEPVPVAAAARHALELVQPTAAAKSIALAVDIADDLSVLADRKALDQVLVNLVDNAVKYTPDRGHVAIRARAAAAGRVRIEVADDGPGIAPHQRERVFERFYRVDAGRSRALGGTGLGLSIVRNLVEAMEGRVGVEAAAPHGSVFWLELQRAER
jgi:two-component system phosphate regulon sensor histidine kinase PhoR